LTDRALKIAGLVGLAVGVTGAALVTQTLEARAPVPLRALPEMLRLGWMWLLAAHITAAGLIVLLAGLQGVPLFSSRRAFSGGLAKLAGASFIILAFAYANLGNVAQLEQIEDRWWIELPILVIFVGVVRLGVALLRRGWKYDAVPASELLARDPRPPIVYLRSFQIDDQITPGADTLLKRAAAIFTYMSAITPEQELAVVLGRLGPVVAIGRPGEPLPELGAARMYVDDAHWQETVRGLIARARLVVVRAGPTDNLWWELEQAMALVPRQRVLIVSLGTRNELGAFDARFEQAFGRPRPGASPLPAASYEWIGWLLAKPTPAGRIIYFDESGAPREEPLRIAFSWMGMLTGLARPYGDTIRSAMRRVFNDLGLPWELPPSQTVAVLLGVLGGGTFGLHLFYLGERRRALKYLAFFWTSVPFFLGIYQAVRLALVDRGTFASRFQRG
jgi:hypothetical protein